MAGLDGERAALGAKTFNHARSVLPNTEVYQVDISLLNRLNKLGDFPGKVKSRL
jgi:hypothetical protein